MKPPYILFMARRFPPSFGGMEQFAYHLSSEIQARTNISLVTWGKRTRLSNIVGLPYIFFKSFWRLLTIRNITIIHCQDGVSSPLAWLLSRLFHKPYVVIVHGLDLTYKNKFYQAVNIWFIRRADHVIAISDQTRLEALQRGIAGSKLTIIPLGIDDFISPQTKNRAEILTAIGYKDFVDKQIIFTVARLVKRKGVAWFINEVLPALYKNNPAIRYIVVGDGSSRAEVEAAIKAQGLEKIVYLLGRASDEVKHGFFVASDIFVMPNIPVEGDMEGFGIVAQEAAVARLPLVASRLEGIVNAIHDKKNGWLITPRDAKAYEKAITQLLADSSLRHKLGEQARQYTLEHFGWQVIARQYMDLYQNLAPRSRPRSLKFILSLVILAITFGAVAVYISHNQEVVSQLFHINPLVLFQLIALYFCMFGSLLAVLYFSVLFYGKKLSWRDNFLVSSYSSLTNFFGPTQAGSGVRAIYLKAKLKLSIKDFVFISLVYYAFYATLSIILLLAGAGLWQRSLLAAALVASFSLGIVRWYKRRSKLGPARYNLVAMSGIFIATLLQLFFQSTIYFVEIISIHPAATYLQALSFTGAANFSLFVSLTPGAIGIREAFLLFSQGLHHISSDIIVGAGILDRAVYIVFLGLLFLVIVTLHGRKKIQALRASE